MSRRINIFWHQSMAFCPVCQEPLGQEEIDFECCDACGGEGFDDDGDEDFAHD